MKCTPEKKVEEEEKESAMDGEDQVGGKTDGGQKREKGLARQLQSITPPAPASISPPHLYHLQ